jgi:DUF917 family protein
MTIWYNYKGDLLSTGELVQRKRAEVDEHLQKQGHLVDNGRVVRNGKIEKIDYHNEWNRLNK